MKILRFALTRSAEVYLFLLVLAWGATVSMALRTLLVFMIALNPLSPISQWLAVLLSLPVLLLTILFARATILEWKGHFRQPFVRTLPMLGTGVLLASFLALQFFPKPIDGTFTDDAPFDLPWFYVEQTTFGFPDPFLRILANSLPELGIGRTIFDVTTFITNLIVLAVVIAFAMFGCKLFLWIRVFLARKANLVAKTV